MMSVIDTINRKMGQGVPALKEFGCTVYCKTCSYKKLTIRFFPFRELAPKQNDKFGHVGVRENLKTTKIWAALA